LVPFPTCSRQTVILPRAAAAQPARRSSSARPPFYGHRMREKAGRRQKIPPPPGTPHAADGATPCAHEASSPAQHKAEVSGQRRHAATPQEWALKAKRVFRAAVQQVSSNSAHRRERDEEGIRRQG